MHSVALRNARRKWVENGKTVKEMHTAVKGKLLALTGIPFGLKLEKRKINEPN